MTHQRVTDHGHPRKYWTQVPNLIDDSDLDPFARTLLLHYLRIAGQRDACEETVRETVERCRMSHGMVIKARRALESEGWVRLEDMGGHGRGAVIRIHILDRWGENMSKYGDTGRPELRNGHVVTNSAEVGAEWSPGDQNGHVVTNSASNGHGVTNAFHHVTNSISPPLLTKELKEQDVKTVKEPSRARARDLISKDDDLRICEACDERLPPEQPSGLRVCVPCAKGARARASPS